jgi:hypothetical protein
MKFDSHIKITTAAIRLLKGRCPRPNVCNSPLFRETPRAWVDTRRSIPRDNYASAALPVARGIYTTLVRQLPFGQAQAEAVDGIVDWLFSNDLANWVSAVDVNQPWSHRHPAGQRYHFQRAPGESHYEGYKNGLGFIHFHTSQWVNHVKRVVTRHRDPFAHASHWEIQRYKFELSLALHSLQDSFSTGHTVRRLTSDANSVAVAASVLSGGPAWGAPPIVELTVYQEQDKDRHAEDDYASGGLSTGTGRMAVEASADLISMGIVSIAGSGGLVGWDRFVAKWLPERINRNAQPAKVAQNGVKSAATR